MRESDESAYLRYLKGEEDGLRILLERHREHFTLFLMGYVHDMEDAEELMMDAFAVAASGTAHFSGRSSFKTWLYGIGRNLALKHLRRRRLRFATQSRASNAGESAAPEVQMLLNERNRQLYMALKQLPEDYRNVLYLQEIEGMATEEIAKVTGKTRKQIYNLSFRGEKALKETLERMGFDDAQD